MEVYDYEVCYHKDNKLSKLENGNDTNNITRLRLILSIALPAIVACLITRIQDTINIIFLGHLGNKAMVAGVGMGNSCINLMGMTIIIGMN